MRSRYLATQNGVAFNMNTTDRVVHVLCIHQNTAAANRGDVGHFILCDPNTPILGHGGSTFVETVDFSSGRANNCGPENWALSRKDDYWNTSRTSHYPSIVSEADDIRNSVFDSFFLVYEDKKFLSYIGTI